MIGESESESAWSEFLGRLKERGLRRVDLVVSDDHKGLVKAVQTNFIENLLEACPKGLQEEFHGRLRLSSMCRSWTRPGG